MKTLGKYFERKNFTYFESSTLYTEEEMGFPFLSYLIILLFCLLKCGNGEGFNVRLSRQNDDLYANDVLTSGDDIYVVGYCYTDDVHMSSSADSLICKLPLDASTVEWCVAFGENATSEYDNPYDATFSHDGHILLTGEADYQYYITKFDVNDGSIRFSTKVNNEDGVYFNPGGIAADPVGGKIVVGGDVYKSTVGTGTTLGYIYFFDSGEPADYLTCRTVYTIDQRDYINSISAFPDGSGVLVAGHSDADQGSYDVTITKYNWDGFLQYSFYIGSSTYSESWDPTAIAASDGTIWFATYVSGCIWVMNMGGPSFVSYLSKRICSESGDLYLEAIYELSDGVALVGEHCCPQKGFMIQMDNFGNVVDFRVVSDRVSFFTGVTSVDGKITAVGKHYTDYTAMTLIQFRDDHLGCYEEDYTDAVDVTDYAYSQGTHSGWRSCAYTDTEYTVAVSHRPEVEIDHCFSCFGLEGDNDLVCSQHGECTYWENCTCNPLYPGTECERWSCWGISVEDIDDYCGNNVTGMITGICVDFDTCFCIPGYSSLEFGRECTEWFCGQQEKSDGTVCSERGDCVSSQTCSCHNDYEGSFCETWSCGSDYLDDSTCSSHGKCLSPNECVCESGFTGTLCETNMMYYTVMAPVLGTFGLTVAGLVSMLFFCILCVIICCLCVCYYGVCGVCCLGLIASFQKFRMKKFGKLKNIDILLKEQEMEEDENVAHLQISKSLFEIAYDEIDLESIIGEGGSSSVVYRAKWKKQTVAFKCFKTRQVCSDQNSFDEFECEVKVMSSISHPNIIRFFGGSLQPPRVGIVMEFCENGDLCNFLKKYAQSNNDEKYPLEEKVRMMHEVASALEYLHSRKILHRDLKLENVLVDLNENCKLMDFGLSKIVERISLAQTKQIGTNIYMSPEIVTSNTYDEKTDVFSFGIMMFILITQIWCPYGQDERLVEVRVSQDPNYRPPIHEVEKCVKSGDVWMIKLMECLWDHDPNKRKTFTEVLEIIEERTVVEDAINDFNQKNPNNRMSVTMRTERSRMSRRFGGGGGDDLFVQYEILEDEKSKVDGEYRRLLKKDRVMRRQLAAVKNEKERLVRLLQQSGVDYQHHAPSAPTRDSKQGVKPEIRNVIERAKRSTSNKMMYKVAPTPPKVSGGSKAPPSKAPPQPKRNWANRDNNHLHPVSRGQAPAPPRSNPNVKKNVLFQKPTPQPPSPQNNQWRQPPQQHPRTPPQRPPQNNQWRQPQQQQQLPPPRRANSFSSSPQQMVNRRQQHPLHPHHQAQQQQQQQHRRANSMAAPRVPGRRGGRAPQVPQVRRGNRPPVPSQKRNYY